MGLVKEIALNNASTVTVLRDGKEQVIKLSPDLGTTLTSGAIQKKLIAVPRVPFEIAKVQGGSPAAKADLKAGDVIVGMNDSTIHFFEDFIQLASQQKGKTVSLKIMRGTETRTVPVTLTETGTIGVQREMEKYYTIKRQPYSLAEAIPAGVGRGVDFLSDQMKAFGQMFRGKISAKDNLGSVISIGSLFPTSWDGEAFWTITASLSIILAFMNLLPIPALDGGYVMFLIFEVITGRKVSDKVMEKAVTVGFFLLLALMALALGLDIWRNLLSRFF
jgi:regulator of sigma E protease